MTPVYVYSEAYLHQQINILKDSFHSNAEVLNTILYAMKAWSNRSVLKLFSNEGLHFDCSSIYEVMRVIQAGVDPSRIELVSQELTKRQLDLLKKVPGSDKVHFIASSMRQLETLLADEQYSNQIAGVRVNPGFGSGYNSKTVVAGPKYSFGIWHEHLD